MRLIVRRDDLVELLAKASVFLAVFSPWIPRLRPFHVSLVPLALGFLLLRFRVIQLHALTGIIALSYLGSVVSAVFFQLPQAVAFLWGPAPLLVLCASIFLGYNVRIDRMRLFRFLAYVALLLAFFVLLEWVFPGSSVTHLFMPAYRVAASGRYAYVVAPLGNPNSTALVLGLLILSLQQLRLLGAGSGGEAPAEVRQRNVLWWLGLGLLLAILFVGVFLGYARTVLVGLLAAEALLVGLLLRGRRKARIALVLLVGVALLAGLVFAGASAQQRRSYGEILSFPEAKGIRVRLERWRNLMRPLWDHKLLLSTGIGWYEGTIQQLPGSTVLQGSTVIDSSYVYLVLAHGAPVCGALVVTALLTFWRKSAMGPVMVLLLICGITFAYLSDYRLNIIIGSLTGWLARLAPSRRERRMA